MRLITWNCNKIWRTPRLDKCQPARLHSHILMIGSKKTSTTWTSVWRATENNHSCKKSTITVTQSKEACRRETHNWGLWRMYILPATSYPARTWIFWRLGPARTTWCARKNKTYLATYLHWKNCRRSRAHKTYSRKLVWIKITPESNRISINAKSGFWSNRSILLRLVR